MLVVIALLLVCGGAALGQGAREDRWSVYSVTNGQLAAGIRRGDALLEVVCADPQSYVLFFSFPEDDLHVSLDDNDTVMLTQRISGDGYVGTMVPLQRGEDRVIFAAWLQTGSSILRNLGRAPRTIEMALRASENATERNAVSFSAKGSTDAMRDFLAECANPDAPGLPTGAWRFEARAPNVSYTNEDGSIFGVGCKNDIFEVFYTVPQTLLDSTIWAENVVDVVLSWPGSEPVILPQALSIPFDDMVAYAPPMLGREDVIERLASTKGLVEVSLSPPGVAEPASYRNSVRVPMQGFAEQFANLSAVCL
jgi:hypothetical protein